MDSTGRWNDARLGEFARRTEENFREVRAEIRDEVGGLRGAVRNVEAGLRDEMNQGFDRIDRRFNVLFAALATGFVAAVVQHFLG